MIALFAVAGVPVPLFLALVRLCGHVTPVLIVPAALSAAFLFGLRNRRALWGATAPVRLYLVTWPFFIWWTAGLVFLFAAPLALGVGWLIHLRTNVSLVFALAITVVGVMIAFRQRPWIRAREVVIAGLPQAFDGYRIVQISDLHCGPYARRPRVAGWVTAANQLKGDMVAVTGDLIASGPAFVSVVANELGRLRARDGVFVCMGNHDYFTDGEAMVQALEGAGLSVLRNRGVDIQRGEATIHLAGVDDTWSQRHDLDRALAKRPPGTRAVLLAHDPALFSQAAQRGVDLTLSGHTHGGQLAMPIFGRRWNLARLMTSFTTDLYKIGESTLYVNRGLGTTGPPIRLGVPPEIAVITLRAA
ncbi:MAG TPA: metallophosphoesterase [Polyangia bacterium]|nr:metallophosphoesterase [Polyangia bacterium]